MSTDTTFRVHIDDIRATINIECHMPVCQKLATLRHESKSPSMHLCSNKIAITLAVPDSRSLLVRGQRAAQLVASISRPACSLTWRYISDWKNQSRFWRAGAQLSSSSGGHGVGGLGTVLFY